MIIEKGSFFDIAAAVINTLLITWIPKTKFSFAVGFALQFSKIIYTVCSNLAPTLLSYCTLWHIVVTINISSFCAWRVITSFLNT
jgi:hypothetical protein